MKRKLLCIIVLMLILILSATPVFAASSVSVGMSADSSSANSGDTVTFTVTAKVDSCGSGGIEISYDSNVFTLVSGDWALSGTFMQDFSTSSKDGVFAFDSNSKISGTVFTFKLKVKDNASLGSSKVKVTFTADGISKSDSVSVTVACAHKWDDGKVTKKATCTEDGTKTFTCSLCGGTKTKAIEATGHSYDSGKVTTKATCSTDGTKTYTCSTCGKTKTETIEATGHSYDDGKVTKEATCTVKGEKTQTCSVCGKTKTVSIDALPHTYDHDCDTDCNVCGEERTIEHTYEWATDGTNHWQACSVCGEQTESSPCTYAEELSWNAKQHGYLCDVCGLFKQAQDHDFENDCDTLCEICGYTRETTHIYSEIWVGSPQGHWHECTSCGDVLELVPHTPGEKATETTDQICMDCGYILQVAGNHVHSMAGDWLSNDTGHWYRCICGEYTEPYEHTWGDGIVNMDEGIIIYRCTECGHERAEEYIAPTTPPTTLPTESEVPTEPTEEPKKNDFLNLDLGINLTTLLIAGLAVLLVISICFNIFLLRCLFASKKTGKYARKDPSEYPIVPSTPTEVEPISTTELDLPDTHESTEDT